MSAPFNLFYIHFTATTVSTDRFINVNVENSAGLTAYLYPDKGEHMTTGYKIQPNMILELRLIEQGMQTDFPVTFHAKTEEGEMLKLEGEETFVATPSEKPSDGFLVKITQSCNYCFYLFLIIFYIAS